LEIIYFMYKLCKNRYHIFYVIKYEFMKCNKEFES